MYNDNKILKTILDNTSWWDKLKAEIWCLKWMLIGKIKRFLTQ